jgi:transposase
MKFKVFIGIDVSKLTLDVYLVQGGKHAVFSNNKKGFTEMIEWIMELSGEVLHSEIVIAFEHTGIYSDNLMMFLDEHNIPFTVMSGLEIKRSMGIRRGKSDKTDAKLIAEYLYEKREKIKLFQMPSRTIIALKKLASYRERLVQERSGFKTRINEFKETFPETELEFYTESHKEVIDCFDRQIKQIDSEIRKLIKKEEKLHQQYELINTIKGVGPQTAILMIILTKGFSSFENWRKFASFSGTAPFPNESGLYRGKTKTSNLANKRIKSLLTMCAETSIQHNPEMRLYYQKRVAEGKNKMSTINIIRNKIIARIFAVVNRKSPYVETFKFAA